jgi:hypothetical protein
MFVYTIYIYKNVINYFFKDQMSEEAQECQNKNYREHHIIKLRELMKIS